MLICKIWGLLKFRMSKNEVTLSNTYLQVIAFFDNVLEKSMYFFSIVPQKVIMSHSVLLRLLQDTKKSCPKGISVTWMLQPPVVNDYETK